MTVHGLRSTYVGGRRCDECRSAERDYLRARTAGLPFAGARRATTIPRGWLSAGEAARRLGLSKTCIYDRARTGRLEASRRDGRVYIRLSPDDEQETFERSELATPGEASALLGVGQEAVRAMARTGTLPAVAWNGITRYRRSEVIALLEASRIPPGRLGWSRLK